MALLDYKSFIINENKASGEAFDPDDIINAVKNFAAKIKVEDKRGAFEIWAYLSDRDSQSQQVDEVLTRNGIEIKKVKRASSSTPVTEFLLNGRLIRIVYKPTGGQQMTTLNSTITELVPVLLWKANYTGSPDPQTMIDACRSIDLSSITWASAADKKAASNYIDMFESSPLFAEKMENAYGIYSWLKSQNIKDLIWAYRTKPTVSGYAIPRNSRADIVVESDGEYYGVSVKAKSSSSGKVRKMSSTLFEALRYFGGNYTEDAKSYAWNNVFSGMISEYVTENPEKSAEVSKIDKNNFWELSGASQKINPLLTKIVDEMYKKDPKHIDEIGYYQLQIGARDLLTRMISENPETWVSFVKEKAGVGSVFPVKVVVAHKTHAEEVKEDSLESMAALLEQTPVTAGVVPTNKKGVIVKYGDFSQLFEIRNNSGGNKTSVVFRMAIDQIG